MHIGDDGHLGTAQVVTHTTVEIAGDHIPELTTDDTRRDGKGVLEESPVEVIEFVTGEIRGAVVAIAPGLGQPRPDRRGEARGLLVYEGEEDALSVQTYIWRGDDWGLTAIRRFPRGHEPLAAQPAPAKVRR